MADNNVQDQDAVEDEEQVEQQEGETPESDESRHEPETDEGDADDEDVITIGEETPPHDEDDDAFDGKPAPKFVKDLRVSNREKAKEIRALKQQLAEKSAPQPEAPVLGTKPTLESVDYDTERFESELTEWHERKRKVDQEVEEKKKQEVEAQKEYTGKVSAYKAAAEKLKVSDFDEAEAVVSESFSKLQQNILFDAVSNPTAQAQLVVALGKNEALLKKTASITNPIKFAVALSDLEKQLKVTNRKSAPAPEKVVRGNSTAVGVNDPKLARLEEAADKSGDRTQLVAYKLALKAKAAA